MGRLLYIQMCIAVRKRKIAFITLSPSQLKVPTCNTPNCMVYGELGSYSVSLTIKIRLISFWLKLISTPDDRISKQMYNLIYRMHQNNTHQSAWLNCIRQILEQNGFGYVWLDQGLNIDHMYVKDTLYSCLQDQFVQEWIGIVDAGRTCTLYKH